MNIRIKKLIGAFCICALILGAFVYIIRSGPCTLKIHNDTGKTVSRLIILWPNGTCNYLKEIQNNTTVSLDHILTGEGHIDIFFLFENQQEWRHIGHIGYLCSSLEEEFEVFLSYDSVPVQGGSSEN
jgi:hypothetical protein